MRRILLFSFFFFQAEDGIRDFHVTGVQTCALPIYLLPNFVVWVHSQLISALDRARSHADTRLASGSTVSSDSKYVICLSSIRSRCSRSEEHSSELQSRENLVCRLLLEKKKKKTRYL